MSKEIIIPKKQIELGFQSLLDRYENPTSTSTNNADVAATKTKGDAIFDSSMRQHEAASRLSDTVSLLKDVGQTLSDPKSSKLKCKEAIKITMKTVVPMISIVANEMSAAANIVAPIGGTKYVHTRVETKRRREKTAGDADQRKKQSLKKSMVDDFVGGRSQLSYLPPKSRKMPSRATKNKNILPITVNPPSPKNPPHYTPMEFLEIVEAIQINSAKRRLMIEKIIINEFIPGSLRSAYNMIKKSKDGLPIPCEWRHHSGRPPLISLDGFKQLVDEYSKECGKAIDKNVINNILLKYANENAKKNGYAPSTFVQYNRTTCKNYFALFANQNKINLAKSVVSKTNSRFTAENSLMASVVLLCVVATTHFFVVEREDIKVKEIVNKMDQDDRLLYDLVSAFHGNRPIFPVHPYLLFTSDDKTQYIFEGTIEGKKKDEWILATESAIKGRDTRALYAHDDSNLMNGMRVKLNFNFSGAGTSSAICITVTGLTDRDMPKEDFIVLAIEGLCIGGANVNLQNKGVGYVLLMKSKADAEKERFKFIRDHIFIPFVNASRKEFGKYDQLCDGPIPVKQTAVSWFDGDNSQIAVVKSEPEIYSKNKIIANKHNAGRTGTEQGADLTRAFPLIERLTKITTVSENAECLIKINLEKKLKQLDNEGRFNFGRRKEKAFVDFTCSCPLIYTRSITQPNIMHGFHANGFLDPRFNRLPVMKNIIGTCKKIPTIGEYSACVKALPSLFKYCWNNGDIPDNICEQHGIPQDKDINGVVCRRTAGIRQEYMHRAKCMTHNMVIRQRKMDQLEIDMLQKKRDDKVKFEKRMEYANDFVTVEKLCNIAGVEPSQENLKYCELVHFSNRKVHAAELRSFIFARHPTIKLRKDLPKNKGNLVQAKEGEKNLILVGYEVRENMSRLKSITQEAESERLENEVDTNGDNSQSFNLVSIPMHDIDYTMPSELLSNPGWVDMLTKSFDPSEKMIRPELNDNFKSKADLLFSILRGRLRTHIEHRVQTELQQSHWCFDWARKNLSIVSAYMVLFGHVKDDISCIDDTGCLLTNPTTSSNYLLCTNDEATLQGCYLYYDKNDGVWRRSGKVTGRGFRVRHVEHEKKANARLNETKSTFYDAYPVRGSPRAENPAKAGYFDYLVQYVGASFDSVTNNPVVADFGKTYEDGGIFFFTAKENEKILNVNFKGRSGCEKYLDMIAYLFELGYDISISPSKNVSDSPGFESCGLFTVS